MTYERSRRFPGTPADAKPAAKPSQAPARPTVEEALNATLMLDDFYGQASQFDTGDEADLDRYLGVDLSDKEVEQRLLDLARGVNVGTITSHREVSRVIFDLGPNFGPFGTLSAEANEAAYYVALAIHQHQVGFTDNAKVAALNRPHPQKE
ncbi:MAG: hypothetical protein M1444_03790 [Patescibacteria group bacterium]|nr:hypothetical protein [Patescibacteria group bacterium]